MRSTNRKITSETIDEYTNKPLHERTVSGSVRTIVINSISDKKPEIKIARNFSAAKFLFGGFNSRLSNAI
jgi:hypothetical protein